MNTKQKRFVIILLFQALGLVAWGGLLLFNFDGIINYVFRALCFPAILIGKLISLIKYPGIQILALIASLIICPIAQLVAYTGLGWIISRLIYGDNKKPLIE